MVYEITAAKKRPRSFDSLAGQEFVVATLKNALQNNKISHAYLFSGPRGVGKTSAARILASALNCEKGEAEGPCGVCDSCVEIKKGTSLDVIEIDGASNTSINDIKVIQDEIRFMPSKGKYKVYIIDEVHMLSTSAFNALLKTIEEPPQHIIFIFATTELHKVPATIKSRCQQFNFRLIGIDTIAKLLKEATDDLGIKAEEDALLWIAKEATGSLRDAYTLFDQVVAFSNDEITLNKIREKLGFIDFDKVDELVSLIVKEDRAEVLNKAAGLISFGVSIEQFIVDLAEYFRNILLIKSGVTKESILGYRKERFSKVVVDSISVCAIENAIATLLDLYRNIRFSLNPRFEFELALSKLCGIKNFLTREQILGDLKVLKDSILAGSNNEVISVKKSENNLVEEKKTTVDSSVNTDAFLDFSTMEIDSIKKEILNKIKESTNMMVYTYFSSVIEWKVFGLTFSLMVENDFIRESIEKNIEVFIDIVKKLTNSDYSVKVDVVSKKIVTAPKSADEDIVEAAKNIFMASEV